MRPVLHISLALIAFGCAACGDEDPAEREPYAAARCELFVTGEVDLEGEDADGDGVPNGWDHCPNNPFDWLDSDRDGIGNKSDPDLDGDGLDNDVDPDRDGDGVSDADEEAGGSDPSDPSSLPGLPRFDLDLGVFNAEPGWYMGDLHVHTEASHDSEQPLSGYLPQAVAAGLDFLWITDHRTFDAPFTEAWNQDDVLLVSGIEWGGGGHANMGGIRTDNVADYDDPADVLRSWNLARMQGGVQSLNHYGDDVAYWDEMLEAEPRLVEMLDIFEVWNMWWPASFGKNEASIDLWEGMLADGHRIGAVGGSDVHHMSFPIGFPTTVVYAQSLSVQGILDGLRRGRSYVTQSYPYRDAELEYNYADRGLLDFRIDGDEDGEFEAMMGDTVPPGELQIRVEVQHAHGPVHLFKRGEVFASSVDHTPGGTATITVSDAPEAGDWYRVEEREDEEMDSALLLISSPIYVR